MDSCSQVEKTFQSEGTYGEEDCKCIGLSDRDPGQAWLYVSDDLKIRYPADVGSYCQAWEDKSHPECTQGNADRPPWCSTKWCYVDPCKRKTKHPPKIVMSANRQLKFQGKQAYWSAETCGNEDTWSTSHETM